MRRGARVDEGARLESVCPAMSVDRGFESRPLRQLSPFGFWQEFCKPKSSGTKNLRRR